MNGIPASTLATCVTIGIAFVALIFTIINTQRTSKKDLVTEVNREDNRFEAVRESMTKMNVKLDNLCVTANETRSDVKEMNKDLNVVSQKMRGMEERLAMMSQHIGDVEQRMGDRMNNVEQRMHILETRVLDELDPKGGDK